MIITFGAGNVFAYQTQDASGTAVTNATPVRIAGLQEFSLSFSGEIKEFFGENRFALAVAQGKVKTEGKLKGALLNGTVLNALFFGTGVTSGTMKAIYADATGTVVPGTPYTITPTPPSSGTFGDDLGVVNGATGLPMTKVASSPTTGQYSVSSGAYTFASADTTVRMYISFSYTYSLTAGKLIGLSNLAMGSIPLLRMFYQGQFQGKRALIDMSAVVAPKLMMFGSKNDDFSVPEIDFQAQADASGLSLGSIYIQE